MDYSKILKYTLASSIINTAAITGLLVYLGMDDTSSTKDKIAVVAEENTDKEDKATFKDKGCEDGKPKKPHKKAKIEICIRSMHGKHCRKPDVQSLPADLRSIKITIP